MRIYEYSKLVEVPNKELLAALRNAGFLVKSHMSALTDEQLALLEKKYEKKQPVKEALRQTDSQRVSTDSASGLAKDSTGRQGERAKTKINKEEREPKKSERERASLTEKKSDTGTKKEPSARSPKGQATMQQKHSSSQKAAFDKVFQEPEPKKIEPGTIELRPMVLAEVAQYVGQPVNDLILTLLKWRVLANKNQIITEEVIERLAKEYDVVVIRPEKKEPETTTEKQKDTRKGAHGRSPVVVVLGHVDHGKTSLLDYIRKTRVTAKEKGGITQHLGAYQVDTSHGGLVFLDTPGHEAFSKMRARGVKVADIAVIIIAADDSVMPQTIEAIGHAKAMDVPVVVAINKIDKAPASQIEVVKKDLMRYDLLPEEWGGDVVCMPISAIKGTGVDELVEMIALQTEMLELKADIDGPAVGHVLEAQMEKGRGPVATLLGQHGTMRIGDFFIAGSIVGKINSMVDSHGKRVKKAGPSVPVRVAGFSGLPEAGDSFEVISKNAYRKLRGKRIEPHSGVASQIASSGDVATIKLVIKADNNSSKEALVESIEKLSKKLEKGLTVVQAGVGNITESDVMLAAHTGSTIVGLHVKSEPGIETLAKKQRVKIDTYYIIYKLLEALEARSEAEKEIKTERVQIGEIEVRKVFNIKKVGVIAGCYVKTGRITRESFIEVWRGDEKIGEGTLKSLQRDKKTVKEVHAGFECAFMIEGYEDWQVEDRVMSFIEQPITT